MADTKISALVSGAPVTSVVGTIGFGVSNSGVSQGLTLAQIMTFVNTAPIWAAGSATAGTWPKFTGGTLLTTPVAGTLEYDGNDFYLTNMDGRAAVQSNWLIVLANAYVTSSGSTSLQKLFNIPTNGTITLSAGVYFFECVISLAAMSTTTGTFSFGFLGSSISSAGIAYTALAVKAASGTPSTPQMTVGTSDAAVVIVSTSTSATGEMIIRGRLTAGGAFTCIPAFAVSVASAVQVLPGSYFKIWKAGAGTFASVGPWS